MPPSMLLAAIGPVLWLLLIGLPIEPDRPKVDSPMVLRKEGPLPNGTALWLCWS